MEKMTNKKALAYAIAHLDNAPDEIVQKLEGMMAQLEKKAVSTKKEDAGKVAIKNAILAYLTANAGKGFTVSELQNAIPECNPNVCTNQKASALIRGMLRTDENPAGQIVKYVEKRKSYFMVEGV